MYYEMYLVGYRKQKKYMVFRIFIGEDEEVLLTYIRDYVIVGSLIRNC